VRQFITMDVYPINTTRFGISPSREENLIYVF